jgi:hypothetical protein
MCKAEPNNGAKRFAEYGCDRGRRGSKLDTSPKTLAEKYLGEHALPNAAARASARRVMFAATEKGMAIFEAMRQETQARVARALTQPVAGPLRPLDSAPAQAAAVSQGGPRGEGSTLAQMAANDCEQVLTESAQELFGELQGGLHDRKSNRHVAESAAASPLPLLGFGEPPVAADTDGQQDVDCRICLEYLLVDRVACPPCGHVFHLPCLTETVELRGRCPVCDCTCKRRDIMNLYV